MKNHISITKVSSDNQLEQILALQQANLKTSLTTDEILSEGFVTCKHDFDLLKKMNQPNPHVIILDKDSVVGYCLVMSPNWRGELDVLDSMFERIEHTSFQNQNILSTDYIIVGQVCIHKDYRGKGLFRRMYQFYKGCLADQFKYCITEVEASNVRSLEAHRALGFCTLLCYQPGDGHDWELIIWDWKQ